MNNSKKNLIIIIASFSIMMIIAGCSPKKTDNNIMNIGTNTTNPQTSSPTAVKTLYSNTLSPLVKAGTITQEQSDKVLAAVTNKNNNTENKGTNTPSELNIGSDGLNQGGNGISNPRQENNATGAPKYNGTGTTLNTGTATSQTKNEKVIPNSNISKPIENLSGLVKSGVITQTQADIINKKVEESMRNNKTN